VIKCPFGKTGTLHYILHCYRLEALLEK
jgi:hypothetical protein